MNSTASNSYADELLLTFGICEFRSGERTNVPTSKTNLELKSISADERLNIWESWDIAEITLRGQKTASSVDSAGVKL